MTNDVATMLELVQRNLELKERVALLEMANTKLGERVRELEKIGCRLLTEIHEDDYEDGHYWFSIGETTWQEFVVALRGEYDIRGAK